MEHTSPDGGAALDGVGCIKRQIRLEELNLRRGVAVKSAVSGRVEVLASWRDLRAKHIDQCCTA